MNDNFRKLMQAVDDDLLEEAKAPIAGRKRPVWILAACACLLLVLSLRQVKILSDDMSEDLLR